MTCHDMPEPSFVAGDWLADMVNEPEPVDTVTPPCEVDEPTETLEALLRASLGVRGITVGDDVEAAAEHLVTCTVCLRGLDPCPVADALGIEHDLPPEA